MHVYTPWKTIPIDPMDPVYPTNRAARAKQLDHRGAIDPGPMVRPHPGGMGVAGLAELV